MDFKKLEALALSSFGMLPSDVQEKIAMKMEEKNLKEGDVLIKQGTDSDVMYIIMKGDLDVAVEDRRGKGVHVDTLHAGDLSGMNSLFCPGVLHTATVTAQNDVMVYCLSYNDFQEIFRENPIIANNLFRKLQEINVRDASSKALGTRRFSPYLEPPSSPIQMAVFDAKEYDQASFNNENEHFGFTLKFFEERLRPNTVDLAKGYNVVCVFVNDALPDEVIKGLRRLGVKMIALRCAGYNNVALPMAEALGISVCNVPQYSPHAVAEHAMAMLLTLNRKIHKAYNRVRDSDFSLVGLVGFDLHGKVVGVIGTGRIGRCFAQIALGFGCKVHCFDIHPDQSWAAAQQDVTYMSLDDVLATSDVISLHSPLLPSTHHMINEESIAKMKPGVVLINTSRGGLVDTEALLVGLKSGHIASAGLDVYEGEAGYFFEDMSDKVIQDDVLARLQSMSNVIITSHQAFLTRDALQAIARTTLENCREFSEGKEMEKLTNYVGPDKPREAN